MNAWGNLEMVCVPPPYCTKMWPYSVYLLDYIALKVKTFSNSCKRTRSPRSRGNYTLIPSAAAYSQSASGGWHHWLIDCLVVLVLCSPFLLVITTHQRIDSPSAMFPFRRMMADQALIICQV